MGSLPSTKLGVAPPPTTQVEPTVRTRPQQRWLVLVMLLVLAGAAGLVIAALLT
jgi:hypothetical protein